MRLQKEITDPRKWRDVKPHSVEYRIAQALTWPWPFLFIMTGYMWCALGVQFLALVAMYFIGERDYKWYSAKLKSLR